MKDLTHPSDYHPDLTYERLTLLAEVVRDERAKTFKQRKKKDGLWGISCLAYERTMVAFKELAKTLPWLRFCAENTLAYTLIVGTVPIRVMRADRDVAPPMDAESENLRKLGEQQLLDFDDGRTQADFILRLEHDVREATAFGFVLRAWNLEDTVPYKEWGLANVVTVATPATPITKHEVQPLAPAQFSVVASVGKKDGTAS